MLIMTSQWRAATEKCPKPSSYELEWSQLQGCFECTRQRSLHAGTQNQICGSPPILFKIHQLLLSAALGLSHEGAAHISIALKIASEWYSIFFTLYQQISFISREGDVFPNNFPWLYVIYKMLTECEEQHVQTINILHKFPVSVISRCVWMVWKLEVLTDVSATWLGSCLLF